MESCRYSFGFGQEGRALGCPKRHGQTLVHPGACLGSLGDLWRLSSEQCLGGFPVRGPTK
eukprot:1632814-Pyramimonas_sp.AAC.1